MGLVIALYQFIAVYSLARYFLNHRSHAGGFFSGQIKKPIPFGMGFLIWPELESPSRRRAIARPVWVGVQLRAVFACAKTSPSLRFQTKAKQLAFFMAKFFCEKFGQNWNSSGSRPACRFTSIPDRSHAGGFFSGQKKGLPVPMAQVGL
jgi:hypothetical protein